MKLTTIILTTTLLTACGVQHKASGTVKSENEVRASVAVVFPQCNRPEEPFPLVIDCIKAATKFTIAVEGDAKVVELLKDLKALEEQSVEPEQIQGGI